WWPARAGPPTADSGWPTRRARSDYRELRPRAAPSSGRACQRVRNGRNGGSLRPYAGFAPCSRQSRRYRMRAVTFAGQGGNEVVSLADRPDPARAASEVVVAARFAGLNWADVAQRHGSYPAPPGSPQDIPGLEVAGTVVAVGDAVRTWRTGERVFGIVGGGGLADRVAGHERHLAAIPDSLADDTAAAGPEAYITAHDPGFRHARLE